MIKKQYNNTTRHSQEFDPDKGRTHQSFRDECDINILIDTWLKTGVMPVFDHRSEPRYGDVSDYPTYQESRDIVAAAEQQFALLDPEQQELFGDPLSYLEEVYQASQNEVGTGSPLDVTVPTDRNEEPVTPNPSKKESTHGLPQTDVAP